MKRTSWALCAVVLVGALLRSADAVTAPVELIERDEFIPAAMTIAWDHHPIRLAQHGALPAYAVRLSGLVFGETLTGWRIISVLAGTATIVMLYLIAAAWWGPVPALVAAGLLAVERYHVAISARAIDLPFDLFFVALAMYGFSRFLLAPGTPDAPAGQARRGLYLAAVACALGFLCKELTALLLPAMGLSLLVVRRGGWFRRRELWFALGFFLLVISPDLYSNLTVTRSERMELWRRHQQAALRLGVVVNQNDYVANGLYMSYVDHLSRFRSLGFNKAPFYFYFGGGLDALGVPKTNSFDEFPFMNPVLATVLWLGVVLSLASRRKDNLVKFLLTMFFAVFVPFTVVRLGEPRGVFPTDPEVLWYWVDRTMFPALLLTGRAVILIAERSRHWPEAWRKVSVS